MTLQANPTVTVFEKSPDEGRGLARDMRVRRALEEIDVLRRLDGSGLLEEYPSLYAYVARAEARPAFNRAFDAQRAFFNAAGAM